MTRKTCEKYDTTEEEEDAQNTYEIFFGIEKQSCKLRYLEETLIFHTILC